MGDSGGPSFDTRGNVIGVNSMILASSGGPVGVAFAIPADTVRKVIPQLRDKGSVTRGWIGIGAQSVTPDIAQGLGRGNVRGAIVSSVQGNSPAAKAGLASGDVITAIGGDQIKNSHDLSARIHAMTPGSTAQLDVQRDGAQRSVSITVGELSHQQAATAAPSRRQ
jgi:serine protease Do